MSGTAKADAYFADAMKCKDKDQLKSVTEKHIRGLRPDEIEPFGARFKEKAPLVPAVTAGTTATVSVTIAIPPDTDTDPPD